MLSWNEPELHISSFQRKLSVCTTFVGAWLQTTLDCSVELSPSEIQFSWHRFGWKRKLQLPVPVDVEAASCILHRRRRQLLVELRHSDVSREM